MSSLGEYLDSDRDPESSYADSIHDHHDDKATPSPVEESSHDEYTPPKKSRTSSTLYSTTESRSERLMKAISNRTHDEFRKMCKEIYGGPVCLITQVMDQVCTEMAYVIPRATQYSMVTLYEYCLGLEYKSWHVDTRTNLFPLSPTWHSLFDTKQWLLLPDAATMRDVHNRVKAVIEWRKSPDSKPGFIPLRSQWPSNTKTRYSFISTSYTAQHFALKKDGDIVICQHPFSNLPLLECHILPPYAVINAAQKLSRDQIDGIVRDLHAEQTKEFEELKQRLTLVCDTWDLFMDAEDVAKAWEKPAVD
ncbi:hypothetical protein DFJ58DRAFT_743871 [Suillus subalutaceus]|uniref:uncharacterized protein n=1 Tax=Suillus subalutaceus TaxID=48586 RepID=UPI001B866829|nr:uncharacterized protein DFJ58DRAFT_743842 [Suillus subalutaceus]XP_041246747.1 uncharacterized protein DFJ58DRAFT_743871 [Suillus subalutaceus]KAG1863209.1 hypothetical protein DFJ58DRAFT_743842 [Suillus subalutaceus]KAG1863280.1 hypothetical protein DFJ58DRAFT_743871 [Suillus subalutaceus]